MAQPHASFGAEFLHAFPFEMAAAYLFHIVRNHPFLDGNKRTGAVAALVFLELNGIPIQARPGALYEITMGVATGAVTKDQVAAFLRVHAVTS
jgi:death-on-curing protein